MQKKTPNIQSEFFKNWSREFLRYLDAQEHIDFPNKTHRRIWGFDD